MRFANVAFSLYSTDFMDLIRYALTFPAPHTHYLEVRADVPTSGQDTIELLMAVWTPGSYLVREFARHVEGVAAEGPTGVTLAVKKSAKNRWRIATGGAPAITVTYRVYCREMSVRTNWIEAGFAMLNGAPTFLTLADQTPRPHEVTIVPASGWARSITALAEGDGGPHRYRAPDYDTLVDSPILVGNPAVYEFTVDGKPHYLVNEGDTTFFDGPRAAKDLEAIVGAHHRFWGSLPYDRYLFINMITEVGGGLEHGSSTLLMTGRWATRTRKAYLEWLELASHELFHVWNVKRLRPVELGPFDYERETLTPSMWVVEGITDYYGDVLVHRAGLSTREEYLESLSDKIEQLQTTPGRAVQSATLASIDAWIKHYRPDENSPNTAMSYYTKGAVVAFLLDAKIQRATGGARSLDDVMRAAYQEYSGARGFTQGEFRALVERVARTDFGRFWSSAIDGTGELDYAEALDVLGLRFKAVTTPPEERPKAWIGVTTRDDKGRLVVSQVTRHTPGFVAGVNVDDEIVAIDDVRVRVDGLDHRLEQHAPGERVSLLVARRDRLSRLEVILGAEPPRTWRLEPA
jgi:predicted metalloprotease with PDZ domain